MPKMILEDSFLLDGLKISYKVSGDAKKGPGDLFILNVSNLNFSSKTVQNVADDYIELQKKHGLPEANFIFVDFPGNGESAKSSTPDKHYTIEFFSQALARAVELAQEKLKVKKMQLFVQNGADGSLAGMNLPCIRPEWLEPSSPIQLRLICNLFGTVNFKASVATEILEQRYKDDPRLPTFLAAIKKTADGDIKNWRDLVNNVQIPLSPLFMETDSSNYRYVKWGQKVPIDVTLFFLRAIHLLSPSAKMREQTGYFIDAITGCAIDVWNHLATHQYDGFDLEKIIPANRDLYSKVPILYISGDDDVVASPPELNAYRLVGLLPGNLAEITFKGRADEIRQEYPLLLKAIYEGKMNEDFLQEQSAKLSHYTMGSRYKKLYENIRQEVLHQQPQQAMSTAKNLVALGADKPAVQAEVRATTAPVAAPAVVVAPVVQPEVEARPAMRLA